MEQGSFVADVLSEVKTGHVVEKFSDARIKEMYL